MVHPSMASSPSVALRPSFTKTFSEPLSLPETAIVAAILFVGGTIYCQVYCLIAFEPMHGMHMPLALSMRRSAIEAIPAITAFELSKRALDHSSAMVRLIRIAAIFGVVTMVTVLALLMLRPLWFGTQMPPRLILADRLPGLSVTALAIAWAAQYRRGNSALPSAAGAVTGMPPREHIDWVQAAGNYVEVHFAGRTTMLRMTLGQALLALGRDNFVQIHRSVLVNRGQIQTIDRRLRTWRVVLQDGKQFGVGDSYRAALFDEQPM